MQPVSAQAAPIARRGKSCAHFSAHVPNCPRRIKRVSMFTSSVVSSILAKSHFYMFLSGANLDTTFTSKIRKYIFIVGQDNCWPGHRVPPDMRDQDVPCLGPLVIRTTSQTTRAKGSRSPSQARVTGTTRAQGHARRGRLVPDDACPGQPLANACAGRRTHGSRLIFSNLQLKVCI